MSTTCVFLTVASLAAMSSLAQESPDTTALKATRKVKFTDAKWMAWQGTPTCDANRNLYYVPAPTADPRDVRAKDAVHVMGAWGGIETAFELHSMPSDHRLVGLQAAGSRLAVTYRQGPGSYAPFWMAVYSLSLNERLAVYGPVQHSAACYVHEDGLDLFNVLGPRDLVTFSAR